MNPVARTRLYALLGRLLVEGVEALRERIEDLPALAVALLPGQADDRAAEHHRVFGIEVLPYQSAFLAPEGQAGGPELERLLHSSTHWPQRSDTPPDHVGMVLMALAITPGPDAHPLLDQHLLRWLPALTVAVRSTGSSPWTTVLELALELAVAHADALGPRTDWALPPPNLDLDAQNTGLTDIATFLLCPARSGMALTRSAITDLSGAVALPTTFGTRIRMFEHLWFTASDHRRLPALCSALAEAATAWSVGLTSLQAPGWASRARSTATLLRRVEHRIGTQTRA